MEARVITGAGRLDTIEVPEPEPVPGAVVVAVERCGICGTDVSAYRSGEPYPPFLSGHEWCGTVVAVGLTDRCARILDVRRSPLRVGDAAALLARPSGHVTMLGVPGAPVTVDPRRGLARETTVAASLAHTHAEFATTLALLADGRLRVRPLHDATIRLDELDETLSALASGRSPLTKVLVDPSPGSRP